MRTQRNTLRQKFNGIFEDIYRAFRRRNSRDLWLSGVFMAVGVGVLFALQHSLLVGVSVGWGLFLLNDIRNP